MNEEEYLWDRSGEPDPEVARLEEVMGRLKHSGAPLMQRASKVHSARRRVGVLAAAAGLAAAAIGIPMLLRGPLTNWQTPDGARIRAGQTIEPRDGMLIRDENTGTVNIDGGASLRLLQASAKEQRFDLKRGTIHAYIWAPPGQFVVDTPSSKTIDLGCQYTLEVKDGGRGLLTVELGWVAFERNHVESFIPAGAACVTRPGKGPGTPYFRDAPAALTGALDRFDTVGDDAALNSAIAAARPQDALSLWHLMVRTKGAERERVYDRLSALVQLPPAASRDAVMRNESAAIDAAWDALNLGDTDWWRLWKRRW
jgi:hypothetical protein